MTDSTNPQKREYLFKYLKIAEVDGFPPTLVNQELNKLACDGWRVISAYPDPPNTLAVILER